jgi:hypothetical protein
MHTKQTYLSLSVILVMLLFSSVSCMSYTYSEAKANIPAIQSIPENPPVLTHKIMETPVAAPEEIVHIEEPPVEISKNIIFDFPYYHQSSKASQTLQGSITLFSVLFIPLPESHLLDEIVLSEIIEGIRYVAPSILTLTGDIGTFLLLFDSLDMNGVILDEKTAVITSLPIIEMSSNWVILEPAPGKSLQLAVIDLKEKSPLAEFQRNPSYPDSMQSEVQKAHVYRQSVVQTVLEELKPIPTILSASLFEPSGLDWTTSSSFSYRIPFDWPMETFLIDNNFIDSFRVTHFNEETNPGNTWIGYIHGDLYEERLDYIYVKSVIPVESKILGVESLLNPKDSNNPARLAVFGTFILP